MSIPNPTIPEEIAISQAWTEQTFAQETTGSPPSGAQSASVVGTAPVFLWQDTSVTPNRWFRLINTGNGFKLSTGTGTAQPSVWTDLWFITDTTLATIYLALQGITLDWRGQVAATLIARAFVGTEVNPRFTLDSNGQMQWGPGGAVAVDTTLARVAAAVLQVTGNLRGTAAPSAASDFTTKSYVDAADQLRLLLSGGTMTGDLVLFSGAPSTAASAAPKSYVDATGQRNPTVFTGAGAPSATTLAAGNYVVGNLYWDTTNSVLYVCSTAGTASTSVWTQQVALVLAQTLTNKTLTSVARTSQTAAFGATVTINLVSGDQAFLTYTSSFTLAAPLNPVTGQILTIKFIHDATANVYVITWNAVFKRSGGAFANTNAASAVDTIIFEYDGANWNEIGRALNLS